MRLFSWTFLLLAAGFFAGCQSHSPTPQEQVVQENQDRRLNRIKDELVSQSQYEAQEWEQFKATWQQLDQDQKNCVVKTKDNGNAIVQYVNHQFEQFQKNLPEYKKDIDRQLNGDLNRAADTGALLIP
jgi:hypothetical protein